MASCKLKYGATTKRFSLFKIGSPDGNGSLYVPAIAGQFNLQSVELDEVVPSIDNDGFTLEKYTPDSTHTVTGEPKLGGSNRKADGVSFM